jgi:hypothetical protein
MFAGQPWPASLIALLASIAGALLATRGYQRRLLAAWTALAAIFVLNPVMGPLLIEHVTSSNIYWRLFYTLPFPLAAGLLAGQLLDQPRWNGARRRLAALGTVAVAIALHFAPASPSVYRELSTVGRPRYNVDLPNLALAQRVAAVAPPGPMLAPLRIALFLPLVLADRPQLVTRESELLMWMTELGAGIQVAELRQSAAEFAAGEPGGTLDALIAVLERYPLRSVVVAAGVLAQERAAAALRESGFGSPQPIDGYVLLTRD